MAGAVYEACPTNAMRTADPANSTTTAATLASDAADESKMVYFGLTAVLGWFVLFGLGLFINSATYRDALLKDGFSWHNFVMGLMTYTPTNVGALCLVSAFLGGCTSRLQTRFREKRRTRQSSRKAWERDTPASETSAPAAGTAAGETKGDAEELAAAASQLDESTLYRTENPVASMLRGFAVYGAYMAGSFIATDKPFTATSPELYARVAGVTSLAAFSVGFDPTFLYGLIGLKGRNGPSAK
jgi:hypothetical protein